MFRRYEAHIALIVKEFPRQVSLSVKEGSVHTFISRLRDSISSLLEFNWPTSIDVEQLKKIRPDLEIVLKDGLVVARHKADKVLKSLGEINDVVSTQDNFSFVLEEPEAAVVFSLAILLDRKILTKPVKIIKVPESILKQLTDQFDIGVTKNEAGHTIMI